MRIRLPSSAFRQRSAAFWPVRVIAAPRRTRSRWEGRIVSLTGATEGFPTMEEAKADGLFHPNCTHRIEYLDEDEVAAALAERDARLGKQEPEDASGDGKPPEPPKNGEEPKLDKKAERNAKSALGLFRRFDKEADAIPDGPSAQGAFDALKKKVQDGEAALRSLRDRLSEKTRLSLKAALESAKKRLEAERIDHFGGTKEETDWARMYKIGVTEKTSGLDPIGTPQRPSSNPNFLTGERKWYLNCQRCVVATEMRRRGFDVVAGPRKARLDTVRSHWQKMFDGIHWNHGLQDKAAVETNVDSMPEGARGIVYVIWKQGGAHVFSFEKSQSGIRFFDPQSGENNYDPFSLGKNGSFQVARIDELPILKWGARACVKATSGPSQP